MAGMSLTDKVKHEGCRKALSDAVGSALWDAKRSLEHAGEHENGKLKNFAKEIAKAKQQIKDAESCYTEMLNYE